jgi:hypothetical protein
MPSQSFYKITNSRVLLVLRNFPLGYIEFSACVLCFIHFILLKLSEHLIRYIHRWTESCRDTHKGMMLIYYIRESAGTWEGLPGLTWGQVGGKKRRGDE